MLLFLLVAFGIATPAFLAITPNTPAISSYAFLMIGSCAPAIAAMVTLRLQGSPRERLEFKERLLRWRVDLSWYAIAVLLPSGAWFIAFIHCVIAGTYVGANPQALLYLPLILVSGFGQEAGWRGFLLPRLFTRTGPVSASLLLGLIWGAFQLLLYWRDPTYLIIIVILSLALSIVMTWLFIGSGGSVLIIALTHAVFNVWGQLFLPVSIYILAIATALVGLWALFLLMRYGPCLTNLSLAE